MKVNLLQGTYTPTLTPMPGVHKPAPGDVAPVAVQNEIVNSLHIGEPRS